MSDSSVRSLLLRGSSDEVGDKNGVLCWRVDDQQQQQQQRAPLVEEEGCNCFASKSKVSSSSSSCSPDFIGDAAAFKKLFSLALSEESSESATVAIHRVGRLLVVDGGDDSTDSCPSPWPRSSRDNEALRCEDDARLLGVAGMEVEVALNELLSSSQNEEEGVEESKQNELVVSGASEQTRLVVSGASKQLEDIVGSTLAPSEREELNLARVPHEYSRVLAWRVRDLQLVSGSDVVVLPGEKPATLRMAPADWGDVETRRLAVMDYYLENVLAGAPQLALCLERRGVVVGGRVIETGAIPTALSDDRPLFEARNVELHAAALLKFISEHCATDGATYVLRQEKNNAKDLKLFDVSSLCDPTQRKWKWLLATLGVRFAHRIASHLQIKVDDDLHHHHHDQKNLVDPQQERDLRRRQRLLLETALELLAELDELDDDVGTHFVMRALLEEQLATTFLPPQPLEARRRNHRGYPSNENARPLLSFFGGSQRQEWPDFERFRGSEIADLEHAARRLESASDLIRKRLELRGSSETLEARACELSELIADAALALADRHLADCRASALMQELRRAVSRSGDEAKRRAATWHVAAAFAHGISHDRYAWADKGAHASDAVALIAELLLEGQQQLQLQHDEDDDPLATSRAAAARECLSACERGFGKDSAEARVSRERYGDACNDVGRLLLAGNRPDAADVWLGRAIEVLDGVNEARARLNLAIALRQRRTDEACLQTALRQCGRALAALGDVRQDGLWDRIQLETATTDLALGIVRRKRLFGAGWAGLERLPRPSNSAVIDPVVEPFQRAVRVFETFDDPKLGAAHFQLGSFLSFLGRKNFRQRAETHLMEAKRRLDGASRILCAVELCDHYSSFSEQDPKLALRALLELLEPREDVASLIAQMKDVDTGDLPNALAALRARFVPQTKSLLSAAIANQQRNPNIMNACKAAYTVALRDLATSPHQIVDTIDRLKAAVSPLLVFRVATNSGEANPGATVDDVGKKHPPRINR